MLRKNSSSKWKQVLGFDDGASLSKPAPTPSAAKSKDGKSTPKIDTKASSPPLPPPPIYSDLPEVVADQHPEVVNDSPVTLSPGASSVPYPRLPRDITFYRKKQDFLLAPSPPAPSRGDRKPLPAPPHLFYITIQQDESPWEYTRKPDVILHTNASQKSPILSYVEFHTATMKADITLCPYGSDSTPPSDSKSTNFAFPSPTPIQNEANGDLPKFKSERLSPMGGIFSPEKYAFCHTLPRSFVRERFEWRYSSGPFIRTQDGNKESGGLKLIRVTTGETVAVYAGLGNVSNEERSVVGMFRFLAGENLVNLGEEFDILAVMSILTVVEKQRRAVVASKAAFGIN
ncbi:hypothetical protein LCER1_G007965 [Lachnellula cervina]|uniref:Uncharacterized protein n=1 Tax=Lachnellula cervina TaxID=1316786 RepID=A0A7D8UP28_9HELO|nr:hypothetical protein LCER1_G007965 [Lachnellula cervina]